MTRDEFAARVQERARAMADDAAAAWPSTIRLHDRIGPGVVYYYAVSVHGGAEPAQRTLILWSARSGEDDRMQAAPIAETVWQQLALGAADLGWSS